jgi:ubiquinone/menaquinone biosynthesis C-methylase UbiE
MNFARVPPDWQMPQGVDGPLWQYTQTPRLAAEEDAYFAGHPLFQADARALDERFVVPGTLVDLGCGTGRHALRFAARSFAVVAVDLSRPMLQMVRSKAQEAGISLLCAQANLCRLVCFPDESFDYALSMFSTLGMIRGRACRRRALAEAARILRHGGRFAVHAHNLWLNLRDSSGRTWLRTQAWQAIRVGAQLGDRRMDYRGISGMRVHLYRWGELKRELAHAGFRITDVVALDEVSSAPITLPWLLPGFRAGGWIVFAERR